MIWLVGAGPMSVDYVKVLEAQKRDFIVLGRSEFSAKSFEEKTGYKVVTGGIELFLATKPVVPKAAIVSVGVDQLYATTLALIKFGVRNVLVEKPGCTIKSEIEELSQLCKQNNCNVYIAYNRRYLASVIEAQKRILADGGATSFNFEFTEWAHVIQNLDKPHSVMSKWFLANSTHVVDLAFFLGGKPKHLASFSSGELDWHSSASVFSGAGESVSGALFSYGSNWESAGRWSVEILTREARYILRPMEKLVIQKRGEIATNEIKLDLTLEDKFKPGLYKQVESFLNNDTVALCSLEEQLEQFGYFEQIAGYTKQS